MTVFVDTSALYALVDADDAMSSRAQSALPLLRDAERLVTHNYVIAETISLVQRRLGFAALRALVDRLFPVIDVEWVSQELHAHAMSALLASGRRGTSFVDWLSFELMRRVHITRAFAFDRDFEAQGFETIV